LRGTTRRSNPDCLRGNSLDCFAEPVIRPRFARTGWLAMTNPHPSSSGLTGRSSIPETNAQTERPRRTGSPAFAGDDIGGCCSRFLKTRPTFPRREFASELLQEPPSESKRAQGMPGAGRNPWPACSKKSRRQLPQVQPNHPAFPARWCYGLYVLSPGTGLFCPRRPRASSAHGLDTSVGVSGPHDFTVRDHVSRPRQKRADMTASIASRLTCRDDSAYAPLAEAGRRGSCL